MWRRLAIGGAAACFVLASTRAAESVKARSQSRELLGQTLPICVGGPFRGSPVPTEPPGRPTCRALASRVLQNFPKLHPGYHYAGSATNSSNYFGAFSSLQVQDPD